MPTWSPAPRRQPVPVPAPLGQHTFPYAWCFLLIRWRWPMLSFLTFRQDCLKAPSTSSMLRQHIILVPALCSLFSHIGQSLRCDTIHAVLSCVKRLASSHMAH